MRRFQLLILAGALVGLAVMAAPAALATHSPGSRVPPSPSPSVTPGITPTPTPVSQGNGNFFNKLKDSLLQFKNDLQQGTMNLVKWMVDPRGVLETIGNYLMTAVTGNAVEIVATGKSQQIPIGAIPMPPGDWYLTGGAIGGVNKLTAGLLGTPPASGVYYAQRLWHRINGTAYASNGVGFNSNLINLLEVWRAFRDLSYALFAIVFLGVGLMIMMRVKISQQAVMGIENALPKLAGALVLITFSYAIAGFMIDLMYVFIGVIMALLKTRDLLPSFLFMTKYKPLMDYARPTIHSMMGGSILNLLPTVLLSENAARMLGMTMGMAFTPLGAVTGGIIFPLIWSMVILYLGFKIFLALIKTYVAIIVLIIFAPVQIAAGAMPGSKSGFGSWLKNLTANLLVFPTVVLVLMIGGYLSTNTKALWYPPFLGTPLGDMGIASHFAGNLAGAAIAIGVIMMLPAIPKTIKRAMGIEGGMFAEATGGLVAGLVAATAPIRKPFQVAQMGFEKNMAEEMGGPIASMTTRGVKKIGGAVGGAKGRLLGKLGRKSGSASDNQPSWRDEGAAD